MRNILAAAFGILAASGAYAVTVVQDSVEPGMTVGVNVTGGAFGANTAYNGNALAGVVNLKVDGVDMQAFCIDPFHFSVPSADFNFVPLENAPKSGLAGGYVGPMGSGTALNVSKLWAMAFSPNMTGFEAAALQLAIWEVIGGDHFNWVDPNPAANNTVYDRAQELLGDLPNATATARLVALRSVNGIGQDYVVAAVPDGGTTVLLLGISLAAIGFGRRKSIR